MSVSMFLRLESMVINFLFYFLFLKAEIVFKNSYQKLRSFPAAQFYDREFVRIITILASSFLITITTIALDKTQENLIEVFLMNKILLLFKV